MEGLTCFLGAMAGPGFLKSFIEDEGLTSFFGAMAGSVRMNLDFTFANLLHTGSLSTVAFYFGRNSGT